MPKERNELIQVPGEPHLHIHAQLTTHQGLRIKFAWTFNYKPPFSLVIRIIYCISPFYVLSAGRFWSRKRLFSSINIMTNCEKNCDLREQKLNASDSLVSRLEEMASKYSLTNLKHHKKQLKNSKIKKEVYTSIVSTNFCLPSYE